MRDFIFNIFNGLGLNALNEINILGLNIKINFAEALTNLLLIVCLIAFIFLANAIINILNKYIHTWAHKWLKRG